MLNFKKSLLAAGLILSIFSTSASSSEIMSCSSIAQSANVTVADGYFASNLPPEKMPGYDFKGRNGSMYIYNGGFKFFNTCYKKIIYGGVVLPVINVNREFGVLTGKLKVKLFDVDDIERFKKEFYYLPVTVYGGQTPLSMVMVDISNTDDWDIEFEKLSKSDYVSSIRASLGYQKYKKR